MCSWKNVLSAAGSIKKNIFYFLIWRLREKFQDFKIDGFML